MTTPLETALSFIAQGRCPVPVAFKSKKPTLGKGWQAKAKGITAENAHQYFNGRPQNIGVLLGAPSGGEVDVDLDCPEALALADEYLPPTRAIFGRASKPRSHRLYKVTNAQPTKQHKDAAGKMMVEYRADNVQSVYPPSVHQSGEAIRWDEAGEPAVVDAAELAAAVARLAAAVRLRRGEPVREKANSAKQDPNAKAKPSAAGGQKAVEWCRKYLSKLPDAVEGEGGSNRTLQAACECYRFGLSDRDALALMQEFNRTKCKPVWPESDLVRKLADAKKKVESAGEAGSRLVKAKTSQVAKEEISPGAEQYEPVEEENKVPWHNPLPAWIRNLKQPKLRPHQTVILQAIANRCGAKPIDAHGTLGHAFIGFGGLAELTGMSRRTCIRHVSRLLSMGLLVKTRTGRVNIKTGECLANEYVVPGKYGIDVQRWGSVNLSLPHPPLLANTGGSD